uniref:Uncharacterized protein n=1 Tax=Podoviridae sp. ct2iq11 TaxID=2827720 RepID=A0A8S5TPI7_9CAUD|nr:MAG TPA: hypothetical protein [Podoviridae sp. ct2iq11]
MDRGWTEASGQSGQKSVHLAEKSGVISVRYKAIFWPLSTLSSTGNSGIFLSS